VEEFKDVQDRWGMHKAGVLKQLRNDAGVKEPNLLQVCTCK
jgi:hypothetical protein